MKKISIDDNNSHDNDDIDMINDVDDDKDKNKPIARQYSKIVNNLINNFSIDDD